MSNKMTQARMEKIKSLVKYSYTFYAKKDAYEDIKALVQSVEKMEASIKAALKLYYESEMDTDKSSELIENMHDVLIDSVLPREDT